MLKLYHFWQSGNSREVRIVLSEKGLPFESTFVDVMKGETRTPEFLAMNPFGKVPVLVADGTPIYESNIINEYLEDRYPQPSLMPSDPLARMRVRQIIHWANQHIHANLGPVLVETLLKPEGARDSEMIARRTRAITDAIVHLDKLAAKADYLCGDFSLADAALAPHVTVLALIGIEPGPELLRFHAWVERLKERASYAESAGPAS